MDIQTAQLIHKIRAEHDDKLEKMKSRLDRYEKIVLRLEGLVKEKMVNEKD